MLSENTSAPRHEPGLGLQHVFVPAPAPTSQDATAPPVLLLLHGTGGSEHDLLPLGRALWPGAALLSPRGAVLENGAPRFFRRLAEGVFDLEDLHRRTHELADFVSAAAALYGFEGQNVVAVGFSNGANIAASTLLLRPQVLAGAVLLRPMVPLVPEEIPDLSAKPVFIAAGRRDPLVAIAETERLESLLRSCGASVTLHWSGGGHNLAQDDFAAAQDWAQQVAPTL
jgi:predicted esterase